MYNPKLSQKFTKRAQGEVTRIHFHLIKFYTIEFMTTCLCVYMTTPDCKHIVHCSALSVCPKSGPGFSLAYVMIIFVFFWSVREVVACLVDIGTVVNHHCLNFLFITDKKKNLRAENGLNWYYLAILLKSIP